MPVIHSVQSHSMTAKKRVRRSQHDGCLTHAALWRRGGTCGRPPKRLLQAQASAKRESQE
jgi:hypothetical protein